MNLLSTISASVLAVASANVPTVTLNNGMEMPVVSIGTWQYNDTVAYSAVTSALKLGFNHIDTAHDYSNEEGVGKAIADSPLGREGVFLTTKVPGCGLQGVSILACYADSVKLHEENLQLLNVSSSDLLLVHYPPIDGCSTGCKAIQDQWRALEYLLEQNKTKAIGVSNYCPSCIDCLMEKATVTPAVNQVKYHIGMGVDPIGLVTYCKEKGIVVQAYSPLGDGSSELIDGPLVTPIAKEHNKTGAQVSLKWLVQSGIPLSTKATNPIFLAEDIDLFSWNLTDADMDTLNAATKPAGSPSFLCQK